MVFYQAVDIKKSETFTVPQVPSIHPFILERQVIASVVTKCLLSKRVKMCIEN